MAPARTTRLGAAAALIALLAPSPTLSFPEINETADAKDRVGDATPEPAPTWPEGSLGRQLGQDLGRVFTRPLRLRGREWVLPASLGAGVGALYVWRDKIRSEVQEHRTPSRDEFYEDVRLTGKGVFVPALASVLAALGAARGSRREKQTALLLAESFAASAVYSAIGSFILAAERPEDGESVRFFDAEGHGVSLDAALSASMIAPLDRAYFRPRPGEGPGARFWRRTGRALLYLAPALVAYQRLNQDKHWAPDAALGYATGLWSGRVLCAGYESSAEPRARLSAGGLKLRF